MVAVPPVESSVQNRVAPTFESLVLFITIFVVGLCTIVYELLIGTISSYLLGDSVKQFSITIGLSMTAMGIGTLWSRALRQNLIRWFVSVEIVLGLLGGLSVPLLFVAYSSLSEPAYYVVMLSLIMAIGTLIGLEIPLLARIMEKHYSLRTNISNILALDYFGALAATLLFPFVLLPFFGLFKSSLIIGILNLLVGLFNFWCFRDLMDLRHAPKIKFAVYATMGLLIGLLIGSQSLMQAWESRVYEDRIIFSRQSQYQKIILTKNKRDLRLYLDGSLQFSSIDEYRYHEALVHVPLAAMPHPENVLILGGGDGLAARDLLKYPEIKNITLVDLDPEVTRLASTHYMMLELNNKSLLDPRVKVINADAFQFLEQTEEYFDVIISDLPDPKNASLARLYSREFFTLVRSRLSRQGIFVTQATSPFFAKNAFWCVNTTVESSGFKHVTPYHAYIPSFGDWGFVIASSVRHHPETWTFKAPTRFLDQKMLSTLFSFSKDLETEPVRVSTLNRPAVLEYYLKGWKYWN